MVSRQNKNLRRQALLRAEKDKEEQAKKLADNNAAKAAQESVMLIDNHNPNIRIDRASERKLRIDGIDPSFENLPSTESKTTIVAQKTFTKKGLAGDTKEHHRGPIMSVSRDNTNRPRKVVSNIRRPGPQLTSSSYNISGGIAPEIFDIPTVSPSTVTRPTTSNVRTATSSTSRGIKSQSSAHHSNAGTPAPSFTFRLDKAEMNLHNKPAKLPFFQSFTGFDSFFTFGSPLPVTTRKHNTLESAFAFPAALDTQNFDLVKKGASPNLDQCLSIFDVLGNQNKTELEMASAKAAAASETAKLDIILSNGSQIDNQTNCKPALDPFKSSLEKQNAALAPQGSGDARLSHLAAVPALSTPLLTFENELVRSLVIGGPIDTVSARLLAWARNGEVQLHQSESEHATCQQEQFTTTEVSTNMDLVLYYQPLQIEAKKEQAPKVTDSGTNHPFDRWISQRMFFADTYGHTRMVDLTQTLYDIDVEMDDGASDFDSIASPMKIDTRLAPICDDDEITSSNSSTEDVDLEGFAKFNQTDRAFSAHDTKSPRRDETPATPLSFSDDEDAVDPNLIFSASRSDANADASKEEVTDVSYLGDHCSEIGKLPMAEIDMHEINADIVCVDYSDHAAASNEPERTYKEHITGTKHQMNIRTGHEEIREQTDAEDLGYGSSSPLTEPFPDLPLHPPEDLSRGNQTVTGLKRKDLLLGAEFLAASNANNTPLSDGVAEATQHDSNAVRESLKANTEIIDDVKHMSSLEAFSSDWASELTRLTLGTESLFTFLSNLETGKNGSTTKPAIVTAFLLLVDLEREKLGERSLPLSYTASSVLASQIIPHTIFLGTTSLASLLSHFPFGKHDQTTVDEVYRVFNVMRKEDQRLQVLATTGAMGALGRRLGKLHNC